MAPDRAGRTADLPVFRLFQGSVRARIVLAAALAVSAVLIVASISLVLVVGRLLERPMRGEARARAAEVATLDLSTREPGGGPLTIGALAAPWPTLAQLVDGDGTVLAASDELAGRDPLLRTSPADREPHGVTTLVYGGRTQRFRLDAVAASVGGRAGTVIVATSLGQVDRFTSLLTAVLATAVPVLVALVATLAWWLVGRALRPVEALRTQVAALADPTGHAPRTSTAAAGPGASSAGGRAMTTAATSDDEIGRLSATLDAMLARLAQHRDTQRRFVADASHELRSPVANIRAALDVAGTYPDSRPPGEVLAEVYAQNERMSRLVDDLLVLARAEGGELAAHRDQVDLAHLAASLLDERAATPGVTLRLGAIEEAVVSGDESQLRRIVVNLVDNAQRHAASQVTVSVRSMGRHVRLEVSDDGPGVPESERARIFERFVRLDPARARHQGGSGLGLAIVAELVAAHHGTITVSGGGPGAVFSVRLPRSDSAVGAFSASS